MTHAETRRPRRSRTAPPPPPADLRITYRRLDELVPYAANARTHTPAQVAKLKKSLMAFGWTNPMLVADGGMIAGHGRLAAALELLAEGKAPRLTPSAYEGPTIDLSHLSKAERRAYIIADNRLALDAGWDDHLLHAEIEGLKLDGFDLDLTGFSDLQLRDIIGADEEDTAPAGGSTGAYKEQYGVIVLCKDEAQQAEIYNRLLAEGLQVKVVAT